MKTIVVYESKTGFTRQYALWIAERCGCKTIEAKKLTAQTLRSYERVVFGGWVMGNSIVGLDKLLALNPANAVIFAVGSSPQTEEVEKAIREANNLANTPFFYLEGGFRFDELPLLFRIMLKTIKRVVSKKENQTEQEKHMAKILGTSFDHSDKKQIELLSAFLNQNR